MQDAPSIRIVTLGLFIRGVSILGRFILAVYIGRFLTVSDLGTYGLFAATIILAVYFLGFDFYVFNMREILKENKNKIASLIRDQLVFHAIAYIIICPALFFIFLTDILPYQYFLWFYLVLIFEHLSMECYRLFITLSRPLLANFIFFLKSGFWAYWVVILWNYNPRQFMNLETIWVSWFLGGALSLIISIIVLKKMRLGKLQVVFVDWHRIKKGIRISSRFFVGTISFVLMQHSARYFLDFFQTKAEVGIFTFYSTIANLVNLIVFTSVTMIYYPHIIKYYNTNYIKFKLFLKRFAYLNIFISLVVALLIMCGIKPLLNFMGKEIFYTYIPLLYVLLLANIICNIADIPHYILFVQKKDSIIMWSTILSGIVNIILNFFLIPIWGIAGASWGLMITFLALTIMKSGYLITPVLVKNYKVMQKAGRRFL